MIFIACALAAAEAASSLSFVLRASGFITIGGRRVDLLHGQSCMCVLLVPDPPLPPPPEASASPSTTLPRPSSSTSDCKDGTQVGYSSSPAFSPRESVAVPLGTAAPPAHRDGLPAPPVRKPCAAPTRPCTWSISFVSLRGLPRGHAAVCVRWLESWVGRPLFRGCCRPQVRSYHQIPDRTAAHNKHPQRRRPVLDRATEVLIEL